MTNNRLTTEIIQCPYCWQSIEILIDCSVESQCYVEDCQVCCQPIEIEASVDESDCVMVSVRSQDDI